MDYFPGYIKQKKTKGKGVPITCDLFMKESEIIYTCTLLISAETHKG